MVRVGSEVAARLHGRAGAERWGVSVADFTAALDRSAAKSGASDQREVERYLDGLHVEDLALACACAQGHDQAWEHFVREYRPTLYRAATAMAGDEGRELADSIYGELFGLKERDGERQSLFRYFHGRSSLGTWLRAILAQRHIDRVRATRRLGPLPDEDEPNALEARSSASDPDVDRLATLVREALGRALSRLAARDRLRLGWYYAQEMTLAQIGRLTNEHEATVSRHLSRTRKLLREDVERQLVDVGLDADSIREAFAAVVHDAGDADLTTLLGSDPARKNAPLNRSLDEEAS